MTVYRLACVLLAFSLLTIACQGERAPLDLTMVGGKVLAVGTSATYLLTVNDGATGQPVSGAEIVVRVAKADDSASKGRIVARGSSDTDGYFRAQFDVTKKLASGDNVLLRVAVSHGARRAELEERVWVSTLARVHVVTDKPVYQPGQQVNIRVLALRLPTLTPLAGRDLTLYVKDPRNHVVAKKTLTADDYGIASMAFQIADDVNFGDFAITVHGSDFAPVHPKTFTVERYYLPKFSIELKTDRQAYAPGDMISGKLKATYSDGTPVSGAQVDVQLVCAGMDEPTGSYVTGQLNAAGRAEFSIDLAREGAADWMANGQKEFQLVAYVQDRAGHSENKPLSLHLSNQYFIVESIVADKKLIAGQPNRIHLLAYDRAFAPIGELGVTVDIDGKKAVQRLKTDRSGLASFDYIPTQSDNANVEITVNATRPNGETQIVSEVYPIVRGPSVARIALESPVIPSGQAAGFDVFAETSDATLYFDVSLGSQVYDAGRLRRDGDRYVGTMHIPRAVSGMIVLNVSIFTERGYEILARQVLLVKPAHKLSIDVTPGSDAYRPGDDGELVFQVSDENGQGQAAALGVWAIDRAVYGRTAKPETRLAAHYLLDPGFKYSKASVPKVFRHDTLFTNLDYAPLMTAFSDRQYVVTVVDYMPGMRMVTRNATYLKKRYDRFIDALTPTAPKRRHLHEIAANLDPGDTLDVHGYKMIGAYLPDQSGDIVWVLTSHGSDYNKPDDDRICIAGLTFMADGPNAATRWLNEHTLKQVLSADDYRRYVAIWNQEMPARHSHLENEEGGQDDTMLDRAEGAARKRLEDEKVASSSGVLGALDAGQDPVDRLFGGGGLGVGLEKNTGMLSGLDGVDMRGAGGLGTRGTGLGEGGTPLGIGALGMRGRGGGRRAGVGALRDGSLPVAVAEAEPVYTRSYFPETLFFEPRLITDGSGRAVFPFKVADSITTWDITSQATDLSGGLGDGKQTLTISKPFYIDIVTPFAMMVGDAMQLPVSIHNNTSADLSVALNVETSDSLQIDGDAMPDIHCKAGHVCLATVALAADTPGPAFIDVSAKAGRWQDCIKKSWEITRKTIRLKRFSAGMIETGTPIVLDIPKRAVAVGEASMKLYAQSETMLTDSVAALIRKPTGCFEQTTSKLFTTIMAKKYLTKHDALTPEQSEKLDAYLAEGYQKLLSFTCKGGGFASFKGRACDPALSAYGLLLLNEMKEVYPVNSMLISRTGLFLTRHQLTTGAWLGIKPYASTNSRAILDDALLSTAYIVWLLHEVDPGRFRREIQQGVDFLKTHEVKIGQSAYLSALVVGANLRDYDVLWAEALLKGLAASAQKRAGELFWSAERTTVGSGGFGASVETTALVMLAMHKAGGYSAELVRARNYLARSQNGRGYWYSTQATVLALKALSVTALPVVQGESEHLLMQSAGEVLLAKTYHPDSEMPPFTVALDALAPGKTLLHVT